MKYLKYIFLYLTCCTLFAVNTGKTKNIPTTENKKFSYDLYIPKSYNTKTRKKFPCLYVLGWIGHPFTEGYEKWAEENEIIIISINSAKAELNDGQLGWIYDCVVKDTNKTLRLHRVLRYACGYAAAGNMVTKFAQKYKENISAVFIENHVGNCSLLEKDVRIHFTYCAEDKVFPKDSILEQKSYLDRQGYKVTTTEVPGGRRNPGPHFSEESMTLIHYSLAFDSPRLNSQEKSDAKKNFSGYLKDFFKKHKTQHKSLQKFINSPLFPMAEQKIQKIFQTTWAKLRFKELLKLKPEETLYDLMAYQDRFEQLKTSGKYRKALNKMYAKLDEDPVLSDEKFAWVLYNNIKGNYDPASGSGKTRVKEKLKDFIAKNPGKSATTAAQQFLDQL